MRTGGEGVRLRLFGMAFLVAIVPMVTTCGHSPAGPGDGPYGLGFYLSSVGGQPLPATVVNWPDYHLEFLADTIRFTGNDRWERTRRERFTGLAGTQLRTETLDGTATFGPWRVILQPTCLPDTGDCLPPLEFVPVNGTFLLEYPVTPDSTVLLRYRVLR